MELTSRKDLYLEPGHVCFSSTPLVIRTVLGGCVAVCLWDKDLRHGGVSHFVYPWARTRETATPYYGNAATIALIRLLEERGSRREDLVAQLTGGASRQTLGPHDVGMTNVKAAHHVLNQKGIPVASEDVGGTIRRKILFDTYSGHLVVLKVHKVRDSDWDM